MPYEIFSGNPQDPTRDEVERKTYEHLDSLGIAYDRVDHECAYTIEACAAIDETFGTPMCKNLFLQNRTGTQFYLLLMPGDKPFKTKELSAQIGSSRLSFGSPDSMTALLGVTPGSVTVLALRNDTENRVSLLVDKDLLDAPYLCCHPCRNTSSLRLKTEDVFHRFLPAVRHTPTVVTLFGTE